MSTRLIHRATTELPLLTTPPAFAVEAGGFIHVVAADAGRRGAVHVALDRNGIPAWPANTLPLSLASVGACQSEIIVTGIHQTKGVCWAIGLDARGAVRWETPLTIPISELVWVVPICTGGQPAIVWEIEKDSEGELCIATVKPGDLEPSVASSHTGVAFGLHAAAIGTRVFVLRSYGMERQADIIRIEDGVVNAKAPTVKNAQAIAAIGGRLAVLSWSPDCVFLQWMDDTLAPVGDAEKIVTAAPPSWIRFATLHAAGEDRIAVSYLVGESGDLIELPSGRSEPEEFARHYLSRYDAALNSTVDVVELAPPGIAWITGAWLGDRLFFVHGATGAAMSIFDLDRLP